MLLTFQPALRPGDVLRPSDVVFMYQADRATYAAYGATVLAWGGTPTPKSKAAAEGVRFFGSVGMVTEFSAYHRRFPDRYEEGLCRDIDGRPVKVPWLTDHQSQGVPYWWCCTRQPLFRQFIRERVIETLRAGADGLHVDDHLGTAGGLWLGLCFCDRCVGGFGDFLAAMSEREREALGIQATERFDFREVVRRWKGEGPPDRRVTGHPLWPQWTAYQCRAAAAFMKELRALAAETAGRPVPVGANAGLLWARHLSDYEALDLFSAETDHHASERRFSDLPLFAYRLAEAVGRPYAATASGGDWAFVKEQNKPGLVRGWIALGHAAGQRLMAPHRQWCYTPEKGTHWYQGPAEAFSPLYRFVREHAELFDGYGTHADLVLVVPHRAFTKDTPRWLDIAAKLAAANVSYRVLLAGDEIVDHPLTERDLASGPPLLIPERHEFTPGDERRVSALGAGRRVFATLNEALAGVGPAVKLEAGRPVRALPRVRTGSAVIHLLNFDYDFAADRARPLDVVRVQIDLQLLRLGPEPAVRWVTPDGAARPLSWNNGGIVVPVLDLWGLLVLGEAARGG